MSSYIPIYAVDFDGTLCESQWPGIGAPNTKLIEHLIKRRKEGAKIILWTCRVEERLQEAVEWCREQGLEFDAVNDNLPESIEKYGCNSRKIHADCYIDDKAADKDKYRLPFFDPTPVHFDNEKYPIGSKWSLMIEGSITPVIVKETTMQYDFSKRKRVSHIRLVYCGNRPEMRLYELCQTEEWLSGKLIRVKGNKA